MENWGLRQEITLATSKSYKVTFTAKQLTGVGEMYSGLGFTSVPFFNQVITSSFVTYTYYQSPTDVTAPYDTVYFGGKLATGAEVENTFEIKDVTTQEVGLGWTFSNSGTASSSFGENKFQFVTSGDYTNLVQLQTFDLGKTYKYSFECVDFVSGSALFQFASVTVGPTINAGGIYSGTYTSPTGDDHIQFKRNTACNLGITNVSVEEVGELKVDIGGAPVQSITTSGTHSLTFTAVDSDPFRIYGSTFTGSVTNIFVTQVAGDTLERWWRVNGNIATLTDPAPNVASNGISNAIDWLNDPLTSSDTP